MDAEDWQRLGDAIDDLREMADALRDACWNPDRADDARLRDVRFHLGKVESSLFAVKMHADDA